MKNLSIPIAFVTLLLLGTSARAGAALLPTPAAQVVGHSVKVTWTDTVNQNVTYNFKRSTTSGSGYTTIAPNLAALTATDTSVLPGTTYFYVVSAVSASGIESANSAEVSGTIPGTAPPPPPPPPPPACVSVTANTWSNQSIAAQTGTFTASFDATPASGTMDSVLGLSNGASAAFTSLAPIIWFSNTGTIQARNAGNYTATTSYRYAANTAYHVTLTVNLANHTYSASVHTGTAADTQIALNYAFRTEQATVTQLSNFAAFTNAAMPAISVCNFALGNAPVTVTIAPTSKSLMEGASQQFTATVGNSTNTAVMWTSTGGSVASGLYVAGTTPGTFYVIATSSADPTKSASAAVTVTAPPPPPPTITLLCTGFTAANIPSGTTITLSAVGGGANATLACKLP